jgi:RNA polymerase sigma factor (sigma-70 family)
MEDVSRPEFLGLMDGDPDRAFAGFYTFAVALLSRKPPRPLLSIRPEDRQDIIHDIVYHCVKDDFRVLRRYVPKGRSFAAWLYVVAHNKSLDLISAKGQPAVTLSIHQKEDGRALEQVLSDPGNTHDRQAELSEIVGIVVKAIGRLDEHCQLLLEMAADEFTPKEIVKVLGLAPEQNKKVSDDLRYCRNKLKRLLVEMGADLASMGLG